jgi:CO dehydrogenase/acetyl-CoA synthase beta subunit
MLVGFTNICMITPRHGGILNLINYFGLRIVNDIDGLHRYRCMITSGHEGILNSINYFGSRVVNDIDGLHQY